MQLEERSLPSVSGIIYSDARADGLQDPEENGIEAVEVSLFQEGIQVDEATVYTNAQGEFSFPGSWTGNLTIDVGVPSDYAAITQSDADGRIAVTDNILVRIGLIAASGGESTDATTENDDDELGNEASNANLPNSNDESENVNDEEYIVGILGEKAELTARLEKLELDIATLENDRVKKVSGLEAAETSFQTVRTHYDAALSVRNEATLAVMSADQTLSEMDADPGTDKTAQNYKDAVQATQDTRTQLTIAVANVAVLTPLYQQSLDLRDYYSMEVSSIDCLLEEKRDEAISILQRLIILNRGI